MAFKAEIYSLPSNKVTLKISSVQLLEKLTFVFAVVREHQTAVLALCLEVRKPLFYFTEAKVFFEEGVTVEDGMGVVSVRQKQALISQL